MELEFKGKYVLSGQITCVTGLHIGGAAEGIEIGGVDNPVIKDPLTEYPYIPGSSLKGKLRHLLEWNLGKVEWNKSQNGYTAHFCGECEACILFGASPDNQERLLVRQRVGPTRLTVRDSFATAETVAQWQSWLGEGVYTEVKTENAIDRVTSEANPRPMERVPAGSVFAFEMIFDVYCDTDKALLKNLFTAIRLLENSALGGSGSRGHGQVRFDSLSIEWRPAKYYASGQDSDKCQVSLPGKGAVSEIIKGFDQIKWPC
ncbi:MAG: type III-A CRISPR-associated RAMP protein Csm3 [Anaerolineae bacterium]|nr:type III-A CRISPR-associated RAMP protein Csm3 [Anaerolineae bacterium]